MTTNSDNISILYRELIAACREKGLSRDEIFVIGTMAACEETIEKFGEEEALRLAIGVVNLCKNGDQIFLALERLFGFDEEN